jgi:hypothetical protein
MNEFSEIFSNDLTTEIFCFTTIAFALLYAAAFVLLQRWSRTFGPTTAMHIASCLGAALAAAAIGLGLHAVNITIASARGHVEGATSISPQELHRSVDMKTLPSQTFDDLTFVFTSGK